MTLRQISFLLLFYFANPSFAMFCPTNFNQINIGDSIATVEQLCGKPNQEKKLASEDKGPQVWTFYVTTGPNLTLDNPTASVKMEVAFNNNKVINITANGMSLAGTTLCNNTNIAVGMTTDAVKSACGKPTIIDKGQQQNDTLTPTLMEFKYNTTPPVTLIFENDKLKERK